MAYLAVLSPLMVGLAWAALNVAAVMILADRPQVGLEALGLALSTAIWGVFGTLAVLVPTIGGLCAHDDRGRLGAAAAGATFAALGGVVWLLDVGGNSSDIGSDVLILVRASTIPLFAPAVLVVWMISSRRTAPDAVPSASSSP